jgi:preprotein translocase subunit SecA
MARDPLSERYKQKQRDKDLDRRRRSGMTADEIEAEEELLESTEKVEKFKAEDTPGRNDPCPCGSGKKYKKCCGANK